MTPARPPRPRALHRRYARQRASLLLAGGLLFISCGPSQGSWPSQGARATRGRGFAWGTPAAAALDPWEAAARELEANHGGRRSWLEAETRLNDLCRTLWSDRGRSDSPSCLVLDTADHNAYSIPGRIYITFGLLEAVGADRDALAAILAHEIGHIELGHSLGPSATSENERLDLEREADDRAIVVLERLGIEPQALVRVIGMVSRPENAGFQAARIQNLRLAQSHQTGGNAGSQHPTPKPTAHGE